MLWILAAMTATGLRRRDRGKPFDPERIGLLTMAVVVVVFGVHSLIDWTWFVPGNACVALLCAAWVAGRGPLAARADTPPRRAVLRGAGRRARPARRRWRCSRSRLVTSWAALQPVRSAHAEERGARPRASSASTTRRPRRRARAAQLNPLSVDPLFQLAFIDDARGDTQGAKRALEDATRLQPANVETWRRLGRYRLSVLDDPAARSTRSSSRSTSTRGRPLGPSDYLEASRALKAKG